MRETLFLKLGGSLITDKTGVEVDRPQVLARMGSEIEAARSQRPHLRLLLGHGSGSFGHVAAAKHGTRQGVRTPAQWVGYAEVSAAASRLNGLVMKALRQAELPAIAFQPSASAVCDDGRIVEMAVTPVVQALAAGLVPVVRGDVALDRGRGGTIVSTEEVMAYLVGELRPSWLLLAGETDGVLDSVGQVIPRITPQNFADIQDGLGGSRGTDVTGGMASKVAGMLALVQAHPYLSIRIFSGMPVGNVTQAILNPALGLGTVIAVGA